MEGKARAGTEATVNRWSGTRVDLATASEPGNGLAWLVIAAALAVLGAVGWGAMAVGW